MSRCHRIGQTKVVKVFRLVTRNTYEQALVELANRKLGLERALNGDGEGKPPKNSEEVARLLRCGAHDIVVDDKDDAFVSFSQADIEQILESSTTVQHPGSEGGSVFAKATFAADEGGVALDDPDFWAKMLPQLQTTVAEPLGKRRPKQVARWQHPNLMLPDEPDDPDDDAYEPQLPAAHDSRVSAVNAEQARAHGLTVHEFRAVKGALNGAITELEKEARQQAKHEERAARDREKEERRADRQRETEMAMEEFRAWIARESELAQARAAAASQMDAQPHVALFPGRAFAGEGLGTPGASLPPPPQHLSAHQLSKQGEQQLRAHQVMQMMQADLRQRKRHEMLQAVIRNSQAKLNETLHPETLEALKQKVEANEAELFRTQSSDEYAKSIEEQVRKYDAQTSELIAQKQKAQQEQQAQQAQQAQKEREAQVQAVIAQMTQRQQPQKSSQAQAPEGHQARQQTDMTAEEALAAAAKEGLTLPRHSNLSGYSGIAVDRSSKARPYQAAIGNPSTTGRYLGRFATAEEAALCRARTLEGLKANAGPDVASTSACDRFSAGGGSGPENKARPPIFADLRAKASAPPPQQQPLSATRPPRLAALSATRLIQAFGERRIQEGPRHQAFVPPWTGGDSSAGAAPAAPRRVVAVVDLEEEDEEEEAPPAAELGHAEPLLLTDEAIEAQIASDVSARLSAMVWLQVRSSPISSLRPTSSVHLLDHLDLA